MSSGMVGRQQNTWQSVNMNITTYTTPTCPFCKQLRAFLNGQNIEYTNHDVSADTTKAEEMIHKSGQMGVPVIIIDEEIVVGFDKTKIEELLKTGS